MRRIDKYKKELREEVKATIKGTLIFILAEVLVVTFFGYYACYSNFSATDGNTRIMILHVDKVYVQPRLSKYDSSSVKIVSNNVTYTLIWGGFRSTTFVNNVEKLCEAISKEDTVIAQIKGEAEIVGLQGEKTTYLTVDDYNRYQKSNSIIGIILFTAYQVLYIAVLAIYIRYKHAIWPVKPVEVKRAYD